MTNRYPKESSAATKAIEDTRRYARFSLAHQRRYTFTIYRQGRLRDPDNEVLSSAVSTWETIVKHRLGELLLPVPAEIYLPAQRERHEIASLPLDESSVVRLVSLPSLHREPFDGMLVCQALRHDPVIATTDGAVLQYPVATL